MLAVDMSQIVIAAASADRDFAKTYDIALLRLIILNTLRSYRQKHKKEFGELVLCYDSTDYWRKELFPYYKAHRAAAKEKNKQKGGLDFDIVFKLFTELKVEFKENLPYKQLVVDRCEADDVIAVLVEHCVKEDFFGNREACLILSSDHDFKQLQKFDGVRQFSPLMKQWVVERNPKLFLEEKILLGDAGDGVPNVLSPDNSIIAKIRQKSMTDKQMDRLKTAPTAQDQRNIDRNRALVDLSMIPKEYVDKIIAEFNSAKPAPRSKLLSYFMSKKLNMLTDSLTDF